jgi:hypothetical protein
MIFFTRIVPPVFTLCENKKLLSLSLSFSLSLSLSHSLNSNLRSRKKGGCYLRSALRRTPVELGQFKLGKFWANFRRISGCRQLRIGTSPSSTPKSIHRPFYWFKLMSSTRHVNEGVISQVNATSDTPVTTSGFQPTGIQQSVKEITSPPAAAMLSSSSLRSSKRCFLHF